MSAEKAIISNLVVILVTATGVALLFQRLRLAIIPAYIVAGVVAGPSALGFAKSVPALQEIAHLAVVLLLFGVGMELHLSSLRTGLWRLLASSIGAVVISSCLLFPLGTLFGFSAAQSAVVAMALSLSSTAVVLRHLTLNREMATSHGRLFLAVLVTQDLAVIGMLAAIPIIAGWAGVVPESAAKSVWELVQQSSMMIGGIVAIVLVSQKLIPSLLREALRDRSGEIPLLAGVGVALLTAYLSQKLGFSLEMGAFIAGFILASSPFRYQLAGRMSALRDLFMAVFFTTLGMELQLEVVLEQWNLIVLATCGLLMLKSVAIAGSAWASGISSRLSLRAGISLAQAGEFSLILLAQAGAYSLFNEQQISVIIAIVVVSLILTPLLFSLAPVAYSRVPATNRAPWFFKPWGGELSDGDGEHHAHKAQVVIAGYGPPGKLLARRLERAGTTFCVVELNPDTVKREQAKGHPVLFGDISNEQVLSTLPLEEAEVFALTFPSSRSTKVAVSMARRLAPHLLIVARASTTGDIEPLIAAGADHVVVDEEASADQLYAAVTSNALRSDPVQAVADK